MRRRAVWNMYTGDVDRRSSAPGPERATNKGRNQGRHCRESLPVYWLRQDNRRDRTGSTRCKAGREMTDDMDDELVELKNRIMQMQDAELLRIVEVVRRLS